MITHNLCVLQQKAKELYQKNALLFVSSLFIPLIAPLFFYCQTPVLRGIFYLSIPFIAALLFKNSYEIKKLLSQDKWTWAILSIFIIFMSASVFWSDSGEGSRYLSKGKLFLVLGLTTVSTFYITYKYPKFSDTIKNFYILGATTSALVLIVNYIMVHGFSISSYRLEGMGRASNSVQASLVYGLAIIAVIFGKFSDRYTSFQIYMFKALLVLPSLTVMFLTQSRGPFLSLLTALIILFILTPKNKLKAALYVAIGLMILSIPCYGLIKETDVLNRKTTGRFEVWHTAIDQIMEKPIIGNGLATNKRYAYTRDGTPMTASHIHSLYLSTLFQGGIIGLGLMLTLYFLFAQKYLEMMSTKYQEHLWLGGWVIMGAAFGISDFGGIVINLSTEWLVFWWPIGLVLGHVVRQRNHLQVHPIPQ